MDRLEDVLARAKTALGNEDYDLLRSVADSYVRLTGLVEDKKTTIERLRRLLFGKKSEKTETVFCPGSLEPAPEPAASSGGAQAPDTTAEKPRPQGHGKNGADDYSGATRQAVHHQQLGWGDACPGCRNGRLYSLSKPKRLLRVTGQPPISATVFELERLRCARAVPPPAASGAAVHTRA